MDIERRAHANENGGDEEMRRCQPANPEREIAMAAQQEGDMDENDLRYARNWKADPGERSHRILEWWRSLINITGKSALPRFTEALGIVVLNQPSSAATERVFAAELHTKGCRRPHTRRPCRA